MIEKPFLYIAFIAFQGEHHQQSWNLWSLLIKPHFTSSKEKENLNDNEIY